LISGFCPYEKNPKIGFIQDAPETGNSFQVFYLESLRSAEKQIKK